MSASETGFDGEVNIGCADSLPLTLRFMRAGKTFFNQLHIPKANQLLWNKEDKNLYYINRDRKMFRVEFIEESAK